jgi:hypothetical protein
VVKLDAAGNKEWDRTFGGSESDNLSSLQQTSDGGYILGGYSNSPFSGDKTEASRGGFDYWVVKLDAAGNKEWDRTFGGSESDNLSSLQQTSDGGYILGGSSFSGINGEKTEANKGGCVEVINCPSDYWVVKLNAAGNKEWDKTFGGSDSDELYSLQQTSDGGYILGGSSASPISGDKTEAPRGTGWHGSPGWYDYWVVKLDAAGNKEWDRTFGGELGQEPPEALSSLQQTNDGGYILGGTSDSPISGDKTEASRGLTDYWVVKLNAAGNKEWDRTFGGSESDNLSSLQQTSDGGYILGGTSASPISGEKTEASKGGSDYWVVKLGNPDIILPFKIDFETPSLGGNPRQLINPYIDPATGVTFTAEPFGVVGLVKNRITSACVEPPDDNQKLGTGTSINPEESIGLSGFPIKATFSQPLASVSISVEFQVLAGAPVRLRLFDASDNEVASVTEFALPADGTCGLPGGPRASKTVTATSAQAVSYAIMDVERIGGIEYVFVIDNFEVKAFNLCAQSVIGFTLVNADTHRDIMPLQEGAVINLATLPTQNLKIKAITNPATVGSVVFDLDGTEVVENLRPYRVGGLTPGQHTLTATPYCGARGSGSAGTPLSLNFSVFSQSVTGFTLVNADTHRDIMPLSDGDVIDLSKMPTQNLKIKALTSPATVGSVVFDLNGARVVENLKPYRIGGIVPGQHTLTATPYSTAKGGGLAGTALSINFKVVGAASLSSEQTANVGGGESLSSQIQAAPNPFSDQTAITFSVAERGHATLEVYDLKGALVERLYQEQAEPGRTYTVQLRRNELRNGMYIARLSTGKRLQSLKVVITQ